MEDILLITSAFVFFALCLGLIHFLIHYQGAIKNDLCYLRTCYPWIILFFIICFI